MRALEEAEDWTALAARYQRECERWHGLATSAWMRGEHGVAALYGRRAVDAERDRQRCERMLAAERRWEEAR